MRYLTFDEVVRLNELTVRRHGGHFVPPDNFLHRDALEYLIETVAGELFGTPLYPTLADKAGPYMFNIISNHIFQDGNKRTGLAAALAFALRNGHVLREELVPVYDGERQIPMDLGSHNDFLYHFTLEVASGKVPFESCREWFAVNLISGSGNEA